MANDYEKLAEQSSMQQRLIWLTLAMVALSVPLWYELVAQPGDAVFIWRWSEQQILVESIVSVLHLVIVIAGFFMLGKALKGMPQWPMVRIGTAIWVGLVAIFALLSVVFLNLGESDVIQQYENEGYQVNFIRFSGDEDAQIFAIMSCNHTVLYKNILHMDRLAADSVNTAFDDDNILTASYSLNGRDVRTQRYDVEAFAQQCGEQPRTRG